ncbi:MAG: alpha/beta hydrolase [Anaerolineales bacterium]
MPRSPDEAAPDLGLHHLVHPPSPAAQERQPPLLLLLHGVGSHEADLFTLAPMLDRRLLCLSLRAPFALASGSYAWFEVELSPVSPVIDAAQAEESRRRVAEFIPRAVEHYRADPERVFLLGFSQGAIISLALCLTRPELLAGVVALSGRTLPELFTQEGPLAGRLAPPEALKGMPILVLHGTHDPVLPIHFGRDTRERFGALAVDLMYQELPMAHTISPEALVIVQRWLSDRLDRTEIQSRPRRIPPS